MTNALKMARLVFDEPYCAKAAPIQEVFCNSKDKAYLNGMEDVGRFLFVPWKETQNLIPTSI